jgi:hypothetical protein
MTGGFKVGEVCIGQFINIKPEYNGCECVVIEPEAVRQGTHPLTGALRPRRMAYMVTWSDGYTCMIAGRNLRRKQPPSGELAILRMFDVTAPTPREVESA